MLSISLLEVPQTSKLPTKSGTVYTTVNEHNFTIQHPPHSASSIVHCWRPALDGKMGAWGAGLAEEEEEEGEVEGGEVEVGARGEGLVEEEEGEGGGGRGGGGGGGGEGKEEGEGEVEEAECGCTRATLQNHPFKYVSMLQHSNILKF